MIVGKKSILWILLFFFFAEGIYASHISGSEISYKHLFGNTYQFKLKVYRDCRECKFNNIGGGDNMTNCNEVPNLNITGSLGTTYSHFTSLGTVEIQRKSINDLSSACNTSISKCRTGSNIPLGYEEHVFEGIFDFSSLINEGYCKLDVSITMYSRINSNNFYNFACINLCEGIANSSPEFQSAPNFVHLINESQFQSLGVINSDKDSLSFNLRPAMANRITSINYSGGQSFEEPFTYYCTSGATCAANITGPLVEGFYISKSTGDVAFTPLLINQGGVIVVECEEWKKNASGKYYLAGITRRDVYSEVINLNNHVPRIKNKIYEFNICEGENLNIDIDLEDLPYSGIQFDVVTLDMKTTLKAATLIGLPSNLAPYNIYKINISNTIGLSGKYFITVNAEDNNCPLRGKSSRTFVVNIKKMRELKMMSTVKNCGVLDVGSSGVPNRNIYWTVRDINKAIIKQQFSKKISTQLPAGGKYIIQAFIPAEPDYCEVNEIDTITVKNFTLPVINMGFDYSVCPNTFASIQPEILKTYDNYTIMADGSTITFPYQLKINGAKNIKFKVVQEDGCVAEDNLVIQVFPTLNYRVVSDTMCLNGQFPIELKNIRVNKTEINYIDLASNNPNSTLININKTDWKLDLINPVGNKIVINSVMQDKYMCIYLDTFSVSIIEPDPILVTAPDKLCINSAPIKLQTKNNGFWTCVNYPELLKDNTLTLDKTNNSPLNLVYSEVKLCKNSRTFNIAVMDTTGITFGHDKNIILCENAVSYALQGLPSGGSWSGSNITNNIFYTGPAVGKNSILTYTLRNSNNCYSRDHVSIFVDSMPTLHVKPDKTIICVGSILGLQAQTSYTGNGYWYTDGEGHFDNLNHVITNYQPNINDIQKDKVKFIYTIQTNGVCGNISAETYVKIIDGPTGVIVNNYVNNACEPARITFKSTFKDIDKQYWYINDSLVEEYDYNFEYYAVLKAGDYVVKTKVYNNSCEALAISETITVLPKPTVKMITNPVVKLSREYPRLFLKDISYTRYGHTAKWYMNNQWISDDREFYYRVNETKDSFYIKLVAMSNKGGCSDSLSRLFVFIPNNQLYIPDAFSPDTKGPAENNVFKVIGPQMRIYEIEIYNRFGQKVYMSNDMNAAWDGTYMNQTCIQGVYFYKIVTTDFEGISRDYSGTVTVIR